MKYASGVFFLIVVLLTALLGCSDYDSPTGPASRAAMLTRFWSGEEFFTLTVNDTTFRAWDMVRELTFAPDGTYYFYKPSMSTMVGRSGFWKLEDEGATLRLIDAAGRSEDFTIRELSAVILVLGDTTSRGFALVPYDKWEGVLH